MNWNDLPPLPALRAFSAFAETGNLTRAGEALNVTHAAISQQLRALERHMGVALVNRSGRALTLTPDGKALARALAEGFATIAEAVEDLSTTQAERPVHVSVTPAFAANWLVPRLSEFQEMHPDIDLTLDPSAKLADLSPGGVDIAVRYGAGNWAGLECEPLILTPMAVVGTPGLVKDRPLDNMTVEELAELPWMDEIGTSEASNWLRRRGVDPSIMGPRLHMPGNLVLDAARAGRGIAISARLFVEPDVAAGRLTILFEEPDAGYGYHLVTRPGVLRPAVRHVLRWLKRTAAQAEPGLSLTAAAPRLPRK